MRLTVDGTDVSLHYSMSDRAYIEWDGPFSRVEVKTGFEELAAIRYDIIQQVKETKTIPVDDGVYTVPPGSFVRFSGITLVQMEGE